MPRCAVASGERRPPENFATRAAYVLNRSDDSLVADGLDAVWRADFDRAVAMLHNVDAPGCAALRGRVYVRIGHPERAIAEFERSRLQRLHPRESAELTLIAWVAYRAVGDHIRAKQLAREAQALRDAFQDPLFTLSVMHLLCVHDFIAGSLARSRATALEALRMADAYRNIEAPFPYLFEGNHIRSRLLEVLSAHAAIAGDFAEQERLLVDAVLSSALVRHRDVFGEVNFLANLGTFLSTYPGVRSRELVLSRAESVSWNDHLDAKRTYIKRGLRTNKDIFGSPHSLENFGGRSYPTLAWRVDDIVDRLMHANWASDASFDSELAFAIDLAGRVDWADTRGEEVVGLTSLSALIAPRSPEMATHFMDAYRAKAPTLSGLYVYVWDGRRPALESFADGSIAKARGDFVTALRKYEDARNFWIDRDVPARAAMAGIERFTISREAVDREPAVTFLRMFPNTGFARRLGRAFERSEAARPADFPFLDQGSAA